LQFPARHPAWPEGAGEPWNFGSNNC